MNVSGQLISPASGRRASRRRRPRAADRRSPIAAGTSASAGQGVPATRRPARRAGTQRRRRTRHDPLPMMPTTSRPSRRATYGLGHGAIPELLRAYKAREARRSASPDAGRAAVPGIRAHRSAGERIGGPSRARSRRASPRAEGPDGRYGRHPVSRSPAVSGPQRWSVTARDGANVTNGRPPGTTRSKPINTARGTPWVRRTCGNIGLRQPRCREASRPVGPPGTLASRAPSVLFESGGNWTTAYPAPQRIRAMRASRLLRRQPACHQRACPGDPA